MKKTRNSTTKQKRRGNKKYQHDKLKIFAFEMTVWYTYCHF